MAKDHSPSTAQEWPHPALDLYKQLVLERLADVQCAACGLSLGLATLVSTVTSVGPELNELGLSDTAAARYLAATDDLVVECGGCAARTVHREPVTRAGGDAE